MKTRENQTASVINLIEFNKYLGRALYSVVKHTARKRWGRWRRQTFFSCHRHKRLHQHITNTVFVLLGTKRTSIDLAYERTRSEMHKHQARVSVNEDRQTSGLISRVESQKSRSFERRELKTYTTNGRRFIICSLSVRDTL